MVTQFVINLMTRKYHRTQIKEFEIVTPGNTIEQNTQVDTISTFTSPGYDSHDSDIILQY